MHSLHLRLWCGGQAGRARGVHPSKSHARLILTTSTSRPQFIHHTDTTTHSIFKNYRTSLESIVDSAIDCSFLCLACRMFFSFTFLLLRCSAWNRKRRLKGEGFTSILLSVDNRLLGFRVETNLVAKFDQSDSRKSKLTGPWIEKNNWNEDDCEIQRKRMKNDRRQYLASLICWSIGL